MDPAGGCAGRWRTSGHTHRLTTCASRGLTACGLHNQDCGGTGTPGVVSARTTRRVTAYTLAPSLARETQIKPDCTGGNSATGFTGTVHHRATRDSS